MKYIKLLAAITVLISTMFTFAACSKPAAQDDQRYVVLSPEVAELLAAMGAASRIVGLTEECSYPAELQSIDKVGKFGLPDREKIIALKPAIIFSSGLEQDAITSEFGKLGYRVESFYPRSIAELFEEIHRLGKITGLEKEAKALADSMRSEHQVILDAAKAIKPIKVYLEIYRDPLMSVSDQSFVGELIESAGADNIFPTLERDYARIKAEDVIAAAPDMIICYSRDSMDSILKRKGWQNIPAIRNKMVFFDSDLDPDLIQRAGPRIILGMQRLQELYQIVQEHQGK